MVSYLAYSLTLKMEVTCSSEKLIDVKRTTPRYISEDRALHKHRCENLKSCVVILCIHFRHKSLQQEKRI
jgi:hypothetical protein